MEPERCPACGFDGARYGDQPLLDAVRSQGPTWRTLLTAAGPELRLRPRPEVWSAVEYGAHTRDVLALHVFGVERALTVDEPTFPPVAPDLADAAATTYGQADPDEVAAELTVQAERLARLAEEAGNGAWTRGLTVGDTRHGHSPPSRARTARLDASCRRRRTRPRPASPPDGESCASPRGGRTMKAEVIGRGEGARRYTARGSVMLFKALAEQDDGDLSLMERTLPPGGRRPPAHRAHQLLGGLLRPRRHGVGHRRGRGTDRGTRGLRLVPRGTAHTFGNAGAQARPVCSSSTPRPWTATSPDSTICGTAPNPLRPTRNRRSWPASAWRSSEKDLPGSRRRRGGGPRSRSVPDLPRTSRVSLLLQVVPQARLFVAPQ